MKRINNFLLSILITATLSNCVSIKLTDDWESKQFNETREKKILVVARATDMDVREAYEQEMVLKLKAKGINAVAAYEAFPSLKESKNRSEEEKNQIVKMFIDEGIQAVLLTALKNTKVQESSQERLYDDSFSSTRIGEYGISFMSYLDVNSTSYLTKDLIPENDYINDSGLSHELSSTTYVLEAILYDLTMEKERQLVGVYHIEATDPNSASQVLKGFVKIVSKQFNE